MRAKLLVYIVLSVILLTGVGLVIYYSYRNTLNRPSAKTKPKAETFHNDNLSIVQDNLSTALKELQTNLRTATGQNMNPVLAKYMQGDPKTILAKLRADMKAHNIPSSAFSIQGSNFREPIIYMYNANPTLFRLLGTSGFLKMAGVFVLASAWYGAGQDKSAHSFIDAMECGNKIAWSNVQIWEQMSGSPNPVAQCIGY